MATLKMEMENMRVQKDKKKADILINISFFSYCLRQLDSVVLGLQQSLIAMSGQIII